ncbi:MULTISPECIES: NAD-binding protein [Haloarcula]|uniref:NAD-binding protein n=1 Tax=Haloarcula TaxID=2237 RepID=UPI0023EAB333|nr:NAD-binding protein [Halomicroarcula sp. XH51]
MTLRPSLRDALARTTGPPTLLVVSDCHVGSTLASAFDDGADVRLVTDHEGVAATVRDGVDVTVGDVTALRTLQAADGATAAVVALRRDRQAILVTQLLRAHFDVETVVVLLNDPERREAIEDIATAVVCGATSLATELQRAVETTLTGSEPI